MTDRVHIHLDECYFCVTCEVFTNCNDWCPGCAGKTFLTVQNIWDRRTDERGNTPAAAAVTRIDPNSPEWEGRN